MSLQKLAEDAMRPGKSDINPKGKTRKMPEESRPLGRSTLEERIIEFEDDHRRI
jgi:hypothetical protein